MTGHELSITMRRAFRWGAVAILTGLVVVALLAALGLMAGNRPGDEMFHALGAGLCIATPLCVGAAVLIGELSREEDAARRNRARGAAPRTAGRTSLPRACREQRTACAPTASSS